MKKGVIAIVISIVLIIISQAVEFEGEKSSHGNYYERDKITPMIILGVGIVIFIIGGLIISASVDSSEKKSTHSYFPKIDISSFPDPNTNSKTKFSVENKSTIPYFHKIDVDNFPDPNHNLSVADEIHKLKNLLDQGVITQNEFNAQKKKILS